MRKAWGMTAACALVFLAMFIAPMPLAAIPLAENNPAPGPARDAARDAGDVRVVRVKIALDDILYEWTADGVFPADKITPADGESSSAERDDAAGESLAGESAKLKPETVISFLGVTPLLSVPLDELERRCRESELRLSESGYVYSASVLVLPSRKNPSERTVLVTVSSGFFWRFGGGNAWALFGKDALGGERSSVRLVAGWNRNGAEYAHYRAFGLPLVLGGRFFWLGPGDYSLMNATEGIPDTGSALEGGLTTGWFLSPDFLTGVDVSASADGFGSGTLFSLQPFIQYRKFLVPGSPEAYGNESDIGFDARLFWFPGESAMKGEASAFIHGRLSPSATLAFKAASGTSSGNTGFDLLLSEDRAVRSGYGTDDLFASSYAFCSAELRFLVASIPLSYAMGCDVQLFAFSDAALLSRRAGTADADAEGTTDADGASDAFGADAYGAGLRLLFDNPVFAYFTFSYGLNHDGDGRLMFCGTAGF